MKQKMFKFAMFLTGHDRETIEQMYKDWDSGSEPEYEEILSKILRIICDINEVDINDAKGIDRDTDLITARREYCYFACRLTKKSLSKIGAEINKDHATVLHHKKKIEGWLDIPAYNLKEKLEIIEGKLKS